MAVLKSILPAVFVDSFAESKREQKRLTKMRAGNAFFAKILHRCWLTTLTHLSSHTLDTPSLNERLPRCFTAALLILIISFCSSEYIID
jgi:hypothetical protein